MERLTTSQRVLRSCMKCIEQSNCYNFSCENVYEALDKLADYEDKQEQGLLIELPVPLGTKVYIIEDVYEEIYDPATYSYEVVEAMFDYEFIPVWGEWAFATRSEAEEALDKMGE